jgi:hypothetical protein
MELEEAPNVLRLCPAEWPRRCPHERRRREETVEQMGAGASDLDLVSLTLTGLELEMGAGERTVDLTGDYARGFDASTSTVPSPTVLVLSEVGVRARVEGDLGEINSKGFRREGNSYVNDTYGDSDASLNLDVRGGVGMINLEVIRGRRDDGLKEEK